MLNYRVCGRSRCAKSGLIQRSKNTRVIRSIHLTLALLIFPPAFSLQQKLQLTV
jgi:hypothetical protein